jgi:uncharacterized membrane protein YoaT (DUF817 family)
MVGLTKVIIIYRVNYLTSKYTLQIPVFILSVLNLVFAYVCGGMAMIISRVKNILRSILIVFCLLLAANLHAGDTKFKYRNDYHGYQFVEPGSAEAMVADALVARPIGLVTTVVGSAVYVVSLPFSLLGGNEKQAREKLVYEPSAFTFKRPLGEFSSLD